MADVVEKTGCGYRFVDYSGKTAVLIFGRPPNRHPPPRFLSQGLAFLNTDLEEAESRIKPVLSAVEGSGMTGTLAFGSLIKFRPNRYDGAQPLPQTEIA